nr:hypothetical protein CFP56_37083 [Quercus suber]
MEIKGSAFLEGELQLHARGFDPPTSYRLQRCDPHVRPEEWGRHMAIVDVLEGRCEALELLGLLLRDVDDPSIGEVDDPA